jgi:hypothetical protein
MKSIHRTILAASLTALWALPLAAQRPEGPRPEGHRAPPSPLIMALDLDRDGILSTEEIGRAPESLLTLDRNGDGQLTREDLRPGPHGTGELRRGPGPQVGQDDGEGPRRGPPPPRPADPVFRTLDLDGDGILSADEIAASWKSLLDLDADGDGSLTREELRPHRPEGSMEGRGPGRAGHRERARQ